MPKNEQDPAGSTHEFRVFADQGDTAPSGSNTRLIVGGGVVLLVIIVVIALLMI